MHYVRASLCTIVIKKSWFSDVQFLLKLLGINDNSLLKNVNIVKWVKNKLIEQYKYKWACA